MVDNNIMFAQEANWGIIVKNPLFQGTTAAYLSKILFIEKSPFDLLFAKKNGPLKATKGDSEWSPLEFSTLNTPF